MTRRFRTKSWVIVVVPILVLCGLLTTTYCSYKHDLDSAFARVGDGSTVVNTACGPIEYATAGNGSPVLVVHGAGGGFDQGLVTSLPLVAAGYQVIAVSRFGYLRTPLPADASPAAQADAYACLLDALNLNRVVAVAGSAGVPSVMQFCLRHRRRCSAMFLLVPVAYAPRPADEPPAKIQPLTQFVIDTALRSDFGFWAATRLSREILIGSVLATPLTDVENADGNEKQRVKQILRDSLPISLREQGMRNDNRIAAELPRYDLEHIQAPTLIISVENDQFGTYRNARYTAEHMPHARLVTYPTGGHLCVGRQTEIWSEFMSFLKSLPKS